MKTYFCAIPLFLAACGSQQIETKSAPAPAINPAAAKAAGAAADKGFASWPATGVVRCNVKEAGLTATYQVVATSTARTATVSYTDAFTGGSYTGTEVHDLTKTATVAEEQNKAFAAVWVWDADFGKGQTRGWGFALDISTLTLYANNAIEAQSPAIDAGVAEGFASTDCTYSAQ